MVIVRLTTSIVVLSLMTAAWPTAMAWAQEATPPAAAPASPPAVPQIGMGVTADKAVTSENVPTLSDEDAGAYLAAGYAATQSDFRTAAVYFDRALEADPGNATMQESALLAHVALGEVDAAIARAKEMAAQGASHMIGRILALADAAKVADYPGVIRLLDAAAASDKGSNPDPAPPVAPAPPPPVQGAAPQASQVPDATPPAAETTTEVDLIGDLVRAWALVGQGQMSEAIKGFDKIVTLPGAGPFGRYHKALALASVGDFEGADALFSGKPGSEMRLTRRGIIAHAQILTQLERRDDAAKLLAEAIKAEPDPVLAALQARIAEGEDVPFDVIASASDGIAEVYYNFAGAMVGGELPDASTLVYARIASWLAPSNQDAQLLAAGLLEQMQQYDLAVETYAALPADSPVHPVAELGRANALRRAGQKDEGIAAVRALTKANPTLIPAWMLLGDMLRQDEKFAEAVPVYDTVLGLAKDQLGGADWFTYYARGVALERSKQWDKAEADFRKAIELSPQQPQVLNYLGYSFVDRNINLDEALTLIKAAVAASPEDGYIQDSLGWAYFRLGHYQDAVAPMELAVARMAEDALVNDHLGDVYWAVGRHREARVQWQRALSLATNGDESTDNEVDPDRIRRKIEIGLDQVLKDEGAKPLHGN